MQGNLFTARLCCVSHVLHKVGYLAVLLPFLEKGWCPRLMHRSMCLVRHRVNLSFAPVFLLLPFVLRMIRSMETFSQVHQDRTLQTYPPLALLLAVAEGRYHAHNIPGALKVCDNILENNYVIIINPYCLCKCTGTCPIAK